MTEAEMIEAAVAEGFAGAEVVDTDRIVFDPMFRPFCEENLCGQYGINYACPPSCGSPEEMKQQVLSHKRALVLQTIWETPDFEDKESLKQAKKYHNSAAIRLMKRFQENDCPGFLVGASGCALCSPCKLKNGQACAFPELRYSCMSAYCIFVRKLAEECGLEYSPGDNLTAFFGMYVFA